MTKTPAGPPSQAPIDDTPKFLTLGAWAGGDARWEIVGRRKLDSRVVVPFFLDDRAEPVVGLLHRRRVARALRGAPLAGVETIGFDFKGVDETADILGYGEAMFGGRTPLLLDPAGLQIPLPSFARSIGYLTELSLPLLAPVLRPPALELPVAWDGEEHAIVFRPARAVLDELRAPGAPPCSEDVALLLRSLLPAPPRRWEGAATLPPESVWSFDQLVRLLREPPSPGRFRRLPDPAGRDLRFLRLVRQGAWETVAPATSHSLALLPYVVSGGEPLFLLWREDRVAALERAERAPLFDLPFSEHFVNATAAWIPAAETSPAQLARAAPALLSRALGAKVALRSFEHLGSGEPSPGTSSELRHRAACELEALPALPPGAFLLPASELSRAVADGRIRDPVLTAGLLQLGLDPFAEARRGEPGPRASFLRALTQGSVVQRRLQSYSSIEQEQLSSRTYARLMTLLQHDYGVRIAYPKTAKDREFFKAAFRVFMAADRGEDRGLQGLHWSHDAYHFALGNFAAPEPPDFDAWYESAAPAPPETPPEGPAWEDYSRALKAAENEATFFSFWTLYAEHPPLARHVSKLTFWQALCDLGVTAREPAREIYDAVVDRAELPASVSEHPVYRAREDVRALFQYLLGFRAYHFKDIAKAWSFAVKEPYRGFTARFGIYETELPRYLRHVAGFQARLAATPPGLNPLLAAWADVKVDLHLRVWDVIKALKLLRRASPPGAVRRGFLATAEDFCQDLRREQTILAGVHGQIGDAELTPRNQRAYESIQVEAARLEALRQALWDRVAKTGLLEPSVIAEERARELPR